MLHISIGLAVVGNRKATRVGCFHREVILVTAAHGPPAGSIDGAAL